MRYNTIIIFVLIALILLQFCCCLFWVYSSESFTFSTPAYFTASPSPASKNQPNQSIQMNINLPTIISATPSKFDYVAKFSPVSALHSNSVGQSSKEFKPVVAAPASVVRASETPTTLQNPIDLRASGISPNSPLYVLLMREKDPYYRRRKVPYIDKNEQMSYKRDSVDFNLGNHLDYNQNYNTLDGNSVYHKIPSQKYPNKPYDYSTNVLPPEQYVKLL